MYNHNLASICYAHNILGDVSLNEYIEFSNNFELSFNYLYDALNELTDDVTEDDLKTLLYDAGKIGLENNLRIWFECLYIMLIKQNTGSRIWTLVKMLGIENTLNKLYNAKNNPFGV